MKAPPARSRDIGGKPGVSLAPLAARPSRTRTQSVPPDAHETLRRDTTAPFEHLWPEALAGEAITERFLRGDMHPLKVVARCAHARAAGADMAALRRTERP